MILYEMTLFQLLTRENPYELLLNEPPPPHSLALPLAPPTRVIIRLPICMTSMNSWY